MLAWVNAVLYPITRFWKGVNNIWASDEKIADTLAGDLRLFLLIDTDLRDTLKQEKVSQLRRLNLLLLRTFVVFVHWFTFVRFIKLEVTFDTQSYARFYVTCRWQITTNEDTLDMWGEVYR